MNWGFRDLLPTGVRTVGELADYLRKTWPYFDRKGGKDHLWVFGHDQVRVLACFLPPTSHLPPPTSHLPPPTSYLLQRQRRMASP